MPTTIFSVYLRELIHLFFGNCLAFVSFANVTYISKSENFVELKTLNSLKLVSTSNSDPWQVRYFNVSSTFNFRVLFFFNQDENLIYV